MATPLLFVVALPLVAFAPVTVNCTAAPTTGTPAWVTVAVNVWAVPVTLGPAIAGAKTIVDGAGLTVIVVVALLLSWVSLAVSFSTYVPTTEKNASVIAVFGLLKVTEAGPLTCVQETVRGWFGRP